MVIWNSLADKIIVTSRPSTSALSVELLLRVIDVKYGHFTLLLNETILSKNDLYLGDLPKT